MIVANDKQYLFEKMKVPKAVMYLVIPTIISQLITIIYNWADIFCWTTKRYISNGCYYYLLPSFYDDNCPF
ncbi:MAG: hypothetical protein ACLU5J_03105 [Christensenellales bacterium]